ncbi:hypothetical protein SNOG_14728 [Parastagonospora nodorum SN15]|uniref:Uncharacterized protein n=1 Tax=Phaeosphaeria nodorum (strain SN15 / ATCC MYA-4574 / FGSC 10173) TaxID=321614 RepID=Q0U0L6_PHANO|nr:hypothetical protein SNOG_14728 [Parastagonospora nodorum SN15]EAT77920.1 hypothetical protein SNOG_14728 [Parastagonospora nodorum SN15]
MAVAKPVDFLAFYDCSAGDKAVVQMQKLIQSRSNIGSDAGKLHDRVLELRDAAPQVLDFASPATGA